MPSENTHSNSQSHPRPGLSVHRSASSTHSHSDSPQNTPPHGGKPKQKHVVGGGGGGRLHARVPSNKGIHKLTKLHGNNDGSHENLKKLGRNASATHLKKNHSHTSLQLKRNQSSSDVRRPKSSQGQKGTSVHFEIGDQEDAWEEASSSASPALSRSASRPSSAKQSASNSRPNSRPQSPESTSYKHQPSIVHGSIAKPPPRQPTADAKIITERLLQRTPSHNTTKMSLATATPAPARPHSPDSLDKSQSSVSNSTPKIGSSNHEVISRFVSGSGTPNDSQNYLYNRGKSENKNHDDMKRAQSMGNLTRRDSEEEEQRALAPRSRKSSTSNAYNPPQQSRTQQKLWLQRASSNIEPQQMTPGVAINGISGLHGGLLPGTPLVGAGYDGRDPRIKVQLERTGLEYLVVRRYQDPVGAALKRLALLPGADSTRRIPQSQQTNIRGMNGLSQSLKEANGGRTNQGTPATNGGRVSFEAPGSLDGRDERNGGDVSERLRSLWDKNFEFSSSAD